MSWPEVRHPFPAVTNFCLTIKDKWLWGVSQLEGTLVHFPLVSKEWSDLLTVASLVVPKLMEEMLTFVSIVLPENPPQNWVAYSNHSHCFVGQGFQKVSAGQLICALDGIVWAAGTGGSTSKMASSRFGMVPQCPWPVSLHVVYRPLGLSTRLRLLTSRWFLGSCTSSRVVMKWKVLF